MDYQLVIPCKLGLESVTADELRGLGFKELQVINGRIEFLGDQAAIAKTNLWLRTGEKVLIKLAEFPAPTFDDLFAGIQKITWEKWIPKNGKIDIESTCVLSKLYSLRSTQAITKKAIVENLKKIYRESWLKEDGPTFKIHLEIRKDQAVLLLDTSGTGLYKRGYRQKTGLAPLRETIAAALVHLSGWDYNKAALLDPFCGSGTIAIEAAMIAEGRAPGFSRSFAAEDWPWFSQKIWQTARLEAKTAIIEVESHRIQASDQDDAVLKIAEQNAQSAAVSKIIDFSQKKFEAFASKEDRGVVICNPPYGERLGEVKEAETIYRQMGQLFVKRKGWSYHILSPHPEFEPIFGRKALRKRKLYNGKIKCYFYSFF